MDRRSVLRAAASLVGVIGAAFAAIPFLNSLLPSAKAKALAGPVEVDLSAMRPGELKAYSYRGATVLVLRRTDEMIDALTSMQDHAFDSGDATDPAYAANASRSIRPDFLVISGICTHLGCVPRLRTADEGRGAFGEWWTGGFVCPCHSSAFDYAGRVVRGPAPTNLPVPPHRYASPTRIVIGEEATLS